MKPHTNTTRRRVRPGISLPRPDMACYLAGVVGTAALFSAPQAEAAVTAVSFGFGSVFDASDGGGQKSVTGSLGSYGIIGTAFATGTTAFFENSVYQTGSLSTGQGLLQFFANGTTIGSGTNGPVAINVNGYNGDTQSFMFHTGYGAQLNFPGDQTNQNIGFRTSTNNYGWANVSWDNAGRALTINSAYLNTTAGGTINVGDNGAAAVPEPSRALLVLAGLGGVALRRRRKQAA